MTTCPNCDHQHSINDQYCPQCGQESKLKKVSIWTLVSNFFTEFFSIENRLIETLWKLLFPGKLTTLYFEGKRKPYFSPIKCFLLTSILFVAVLATSISRSEIYKNIEKQSDAFVYKSMERDTYHKIDTFLIQEKKSTPVDSNVIENLRATYHKEFLSSTNESDTIQIGRSAWINILGVEIDVYDFQNMDDDEFDEKYFKDKSFRQKLIVKQILKIAGHGGNFLRHLVGQIGLTIIFTIPVFSLFLWLIYIRRKRFYVEHLVFNFHFHAFLFLLLTTDILARYIIGNSWISALTISIFLIYLFVAIRRYYQQSNFKTITKLLLGSFFYGFTLLISILVMFLLSLVTF